MEKWFLSLLAVAITGCSFLFEEESNHIAVSGVVINSSIAEPLEGVYVALVSGLGVLDSCRTDVDGNYAVSFDPGSDENSKYIKFNQGRYDSRYATYGFNVPAGSQIVRDVELYQNTTLSAEARSPNPVPARSYQLSLPGIGTTISHYLSTNRARGNFKNEVKFTYVRDGERFTIIDSVYCPIDVSTWHLIEY